MVSRNFNVSLTPQNCVSHLRARASVDLDFSEESRFAALHFFEIPSAERNRLSVDELHLVLRQPFLTLTDEGALFEFVLEKCHWKEEYFSLFEYVQFDILAPELVFEFAEEMTQYLHLMSIPIWQRIASRLVLPVITDSSTMGYSAGMSAISHPFRPDDPLNGIIADLNRRGGPDAQGVKVIFSSQIGGLYSASNVARLDDKCDYCSENSQGQFVGYKFESGTLTVTHYSIRTGIDGINPQHWVFEVSENGRAWAEVDRQEDGGLGDRPSLVRSYEVRTVKKARMCRVRQIAPNSQGSHHLWMSSLEIFGNLKQESGFFSLS
jgi:hypothetical protein